MCLLCYNNTKFISRGIKKTLWGTADRIDLKIDKAKTLVIKRDDAEYKIPLMEKNCEACTKEAAEFKMYYRQEGEPDDAIVKHCT